MYRFITSKKRSILMSRIKSRDTIPELKLRKGLWSQGFRFSKKDSKLIGKPDIVLNKYKVAVFIDGEFWHGYRWKEKRKKIKDNRKYWIPKIEKNILRDKRTNKALRENGWKVIRFWEQQIKKDLPKCIQKIKNVIKENSI